MKLKKLLQLTLVLLLVTLLAPRVGAQAANDEQPVYRMSLVWLADEGGVNEYVFRIGQLEFKTVDELKKFIAQLPQGSVLEWHPDCLRRGDEPLLSSAEEMEDFKKFCEEKGITFRFIPSG